MTKKYPKYGVRSLLTAYKEDLRYHVAGGELGNLNSVTSGTPEFASLQEVEDYFKDIDLSIDAVVELVERGPKTSRSSQLEEVLSNTEMLLEQERDDYARLEEQNLALRNVLYLAMGLVSDRRAEMILKDYASKCGVTIATAGE